MMYFLIIVGVLIATNFLILQFSCNDPENQIPEDE